MSKNIFDLPLKICSTNPITGFFRDGHCNTNHQDAGTHVVCAKLTQEFLDFSKSRGNDLITPNLLFNFPGLKPGDHWCLCANRWKEAYEAGVATKINPFATHRKMLDYADIEELKRFFLRKDFLN